MEQAALAIAEFLTGVGERDFLASDLLQSAILQKLSVIGEAAARISLTVREQNPQVEWGVIVGLRNIVVHAYFSISWSAIWETARSDVPELLEDISRILSELPESDPL
ncbi:MAG: DUF86 domain-containing protein [Planctomycetota bacterium]|nr:DUF86 domain-containing protein [Planctomycetota bacterium]